MIKHLGLSNVRVEHLAQAQEIAPIVAVQNRYGVGFGRVNDDILRVCGEQGIAFVPFFALTAASREVGGVASDDAVQEVADQHNATPAQIRLAWTLGRGDQSWLFLGRRALGIWRRTWRPVRSASPPGNSPYSTAWRRLSRSSAGRLSRCG